MRASLRLSILGLPGLSRLGIVTKLDVAGSTPVANTAKIGVEP